ENWNDFDDDLLQKIYDEDSQNEDINTPILGYDVSEVAIRIAEENCKNAGLHRMISLQIKDIEQLVPENTSKGVVVTNPPYGERLVKDEIEVFYKMMGDQFKNNFANYAVWLLSSNMSAIKNIGLHPDQKLTLYNGPLECKFLKYSIYQGSKKSRNSKS
ncbi:MAG TPA: methyltransferase, partial [Bacteroidales bacterium]|nr:methyltransferase [Bacteroidales bacterium]